MVKKILPIIIVVLLSFLAGIALLHPGLPPTHDGEYHVVRFAEFNKTISDGNLYPRWAPDLNNGFGVPLFNYVYPLPNYVASLMHTFGISFIDSFKLEMFLSLIFGGVFFYLWSREFWGDLGGMVSAVSYTFSPYRFVDIYIRGSVGECLALAIFPALLWSLTLFIKTKKKIFFPLSSLLFALLIFSHNILALMFFAFTFFYVIFLIYKSKNRKNLTVECLGIAALGLCLSSVFWFPALLEKKYVVGLEVFDFSSQFPLLYQLLIPSWGSNFAGGGLSNEMSFQIGIANLIAVFFSLFMLFHKKDKNKRVILFFLISFATVFLLMLDVSIFIWKTVPLMNYFQFPWRFLSLEIVLASFLAGGVIYIAKFKKVLAIMLILLAVLLGIGYAKPAYYLNRDDNYYTTRSNFIDGTNSPGNAFNIVGFNNNSKRQDQKLLFTKGSGTIFNANIKSSQYLLSINANQKVTMLVNTSYFPEWNVYIDNKKTEVLKAESGLFSFNVLEGKHNVEVKLEDTIIRKLGTLGFYIGAFILLVLFGKLIFATIKR